METIQESDKQVSGLDAYVERGDFGAYYGTQYGNPLNPNWPWGKPILDDFLYPFLGPDKVVMEIGSGGGRWSQFIMPRCKRSILVDGTKASEAAIRGAIGVPEDADVKFYVSPTGVLSQVKSETVDCVFSFDTFVHFHADLFYRYLSTIARVLKKGGVLCLYYAWDASMAKSFFRYYDPDEMCARLKGLGLEQFDEDLIVLDSRFIKARKV